jgi:hypothetical protein
MNLNIKSFLLGALVTVGAIGGLFFCFFNKNSINDLQRFRKAISVSSPQLPTVQRDDSVPTDFSIEKTSVMYTGGAKAVVGLTDPNNPTVQLVVYEEISCTK